MAEVNGGRRTDDVVEEVASLQRDLLSSFRATVDELNALRDLMLEFRYRNHADGYFARIVRRPK